MGKVDISSKYILAGEPVEWVRWLLQDATAQVEECLSGEFQFILRHSDELFRVRRQQGPFVLLVEVQFVRWDMAVLRESPWYNQILEEGLQQGVLDGRRQDIVHLLRVRFDLTGPRLAAIAAQLAAIEDTERLQDLLVEAMRTASPEAFLEHLDVI